MQVRILWLVTVIIASLSLTGCGGSELPRPVKVQAKQIGPKDILGQYVESGELDSGTSELQDMFETLKTTDATKSAELLSDLKTLKSFKDDANAIKAQAKKMADKL